MKRIGPLLDIIEADADVPPLSRLLSESTAPTKMLRRMLDELADPDGGLVYEVVILDCAPGLGPMTEAVVAVSDLLVTPVVPTPLSLRTLGQFEAFVLDKRPGVPIMAFLSMSDERKVLHRQVLADVSEDRRFGDAVIPVSSSVERMSMEQRPAVDASPHNLAARGYERLWSEVVTRLGL